MKTNILIIILSLIVFTSVLAQSDVEATVTHVSDNITVGDIVSLNLSVTHPEGWRVILPELDSEQWAGIEVVDRQLPEIIQNTDGTETTNQIIDVRLFAPGEYQTPPMLLKVVDDQGISQPIQAPPSPITVESVLVEGDTELRDIKPQVDLSIVNTVSPMPFLIGVLVVSVVGGMIVFMLNRRRNRVVVDTRTPAERALDTLTELDAANLPAEGAYKDHYAQVSAILRRYLQETYNVSAMESTTNEIWQALQTVKIAPDHVKQVIKILMNCDSVKFTPEAPEERITRELTDNARQFINATQFAITNEQANMVHLKEARV